MIRWMRHLLKICPNGCIICVRARMDIRTWDR